jgi:Mlc titration factor MtfA (ptsG expression regulator)
VFVAETYWEGLAGLEVTDEMRVTVAAQVGFLMLGFDEDYLEPLRTILIHPHIEAAPRKSREHGLVTERLTVTHGEALSGGPVRVVWPLALRGGRIGHDGQNVVFHEAAHVLDMLDGYLDGTPPLNDAAVFERWGQVLRREYERLVRLSDAGLPTVIDPYGATNEGEFFAVSTECFFERPHILADRHPEWFELLATYYRQDPRPRLERGGFGL